MVKKNCFIRFKFTGDLDFHRMLMDVYLPILSATKTSISRFQGFVMAISCSAHVPENQDEDEDKDFCTEQNIIMILARDSYTLCSAMADAATACTAHNGSLSISVDVAPVLKMKSRRYKPSFDEFFSKTTYERLLLPYRHRLRSIKGFEIHGKALPDKLAQDIRDEVAQCERADPKAAIEFALEAKERGQREWRAGKPVVACEKWSNAIVDIDRMHRGSSWSSLIERGGEAFIDKIAETSFLICLNSLQAGLKLWSSSAEFPALSDSESLLIDQPVQFANDTISMDNWKEGYIWNPSDVHLAKLQYRQGYFLRLFGGPDVTMASVFIEQALQLLPDDPVLLKGRQLILKQCSDPRF